MANALDQFAVRSGGERGEREITGLPIADARACLDEFVIGERAGHFGGDAVSQPVLADRDERVQGVPEAAQVFLLTFVECHPGIIGGWRQGGFSGDGEAQQKQRTVAQGACE